MLYACGEPLYRVKFLAERAQWGDRLPLKLNLALLVATENFETRIFGGVLHKVAAMKRLLHCLSFTFIIMSPDN